MLTAIAATAEIEAVASNPPQPLPEQSTALRAWQAAELDRPRDIAQPRVRGPRGRVQS